MPVLLSANMVHSIVSLCNIQNMKKLKIGILQQHNIADSSVNMQRLSHGIAQLASRGAELIVLQELHNSLYF